MEELDLKKIIMCILIVVIAIGLIIYAVNRPKEENIIQPRRKLKYTYSIYITRIRKIVTNPKVKPKGFIFLLNLTNL